MIKVSIATLLNSTEALQKLSTTDLKAKLAWQVARLLKAADKEIQEFNETRMKLIQKYGEKDENGELIKDEKDNCRISNDVAEEFSTQLNDLIQAEVEINVNKINIDELDNITFTPADMAMLENFIQFDSEE